MHHYLVEYQLLIPVNLILDIHIYLLLLCDQTKGENAAASGASKPGYFLFSFLCLFIECSYFLVQLLYLLFSHLFSSF